MLVGVTPYFSTNKDQLFDNIINGKLKLPRNFSLEAKSIIIGLLNRNPTKRLGAEPGEGGAREIMDHPFFSDINWNTLLAKQQTGSYIPEPPRYTIQEFVEEFQETTLSPKQIEELYYGTPDENKIKDKIKGTWVSDWDYVRPQSKGNT
jgi:serine/threonine protein kinase